MLVVGGEPEAWVSTFCGLHRSQFSPLADAAAFDPATERWRRNADAPLTFSSNASAVAVGDAVYVLVRGTSYRPAATAASSATDRRPPLGTTSRTSA